MVDAIVREPQTLLKLETRTNRLPHFRYHVFKPHVDFLAQFGRQNSNDSPAIGTTHREEQMEAILPEKDVELVLHHRAGADRVGDEERVFVRGAGKGDAALLAYWTA